MEPVIEIQGLGKRYRIRHQGDRQWTSLREAVSGSVRGLVKRVLGGSFDTAEDFWALRDVAFSVKAGERVGIIGRNGAGKSTLLKLLSRVAEPSAGRITLRGRVASLLEVGTGFHPELSGRENIYLNGVILGMSRAEIRAKFDEIVAFAEVEKFLDTPVKHYSSGMYMRLAFAVAAHLEPEILIVDEVLAVGDAEFQKKCLGRMREIGGQGRTILFVSHQMPAIERLCDRVITLRAGRIVGDSSDVKDALGRYLSVGGEEANAWANDGSVTNEIFVPEALYLSSPDGERLSSGRSNDDDFGVSVLGRCLKADRALNVGVAMYDEEGNLLLWSCQTDAPESEWPRLEAGMRYHFRCPLPKRLLNEGVYRIELILSLYCRQWLCEPGRNSPAIYLDIHGGLSDSPYWPARRPGILGPEWRWTCALKEDA